MKAPARLYAMCSMIQARDFGCGVGCLSSLLVPDMMSRPLSIIIIAMVTGEWSFIFLCFSISHAMGYDTKGRFE